MILLERESYSLSRFYLMRDSINLIEGSILGIIEFTSYKRNQKLIKTNKGKLHQLHQRSGKEQRPARTYLSL